MGKRVSFRDISRTSWETTLPDDGSLPSDMADRITFGSIQRIADAAEAIVKRLDSLNSVLGGVTTELKFLGLEVRWHRVPPDRTVRERESREAESRSRAMAAFLKAGGVAGDVPDVGDGVLSSPVDGSDRRFPATIRVRRCLRRLGVVTVGMLIEKSADDLMETRNFGMTSLTEVRGHLTKLGLSLKGEGAVDN